MKKKGISPLIATVLIIGFTIALAVVIMTWGADLIDRMTKGADEEAELKFRCVDLDFQIKNVMCDGAGMDLTIDNLKSSDTVAHFQIRANKDDGDVVTLDTSGENTSGVGPAGLVNFKDLKGDLEDGNVVESIDVIPVLTAEDGTEHFCTEGGIKSQINLDCVIGTVEA